MEFSRQEYCGGLPFSSPGDLPNPGTECVSPELQANFLPSEPPGKFRYNLALVPPHKLEDASIFPSAE